VELTALLSSARKSANVLIAVGILVETVLDVEQGIYTSLRLILGLNEVVTSSAGAERLRPLDLKGILLRLAGVDRDAKNVAIGGVRHCEELIESVLVEVVKEDV
jgi:hypothetical protein